MELTQKCLKTILEQVNGPGLLYAALNSCQERESMNLALIDVLGRRKLSKDAIRAMYLSLQRVVWIVVGDVVKFVLMRNASTLTFPPLSECLTPIALDLLRRLDDAAYQSLYNNHALLNAALRANLNLVYVIETLGDDAVVPERRNLIFIKKIKMRLDTIPRIIYTSDVTGFKEKIVLENLSSAPLEFTPTTLNDKAEEITKIALTNKDI
jgi:hypothetical protein